MFETQMRGFAVCLAIQHVFFVTDFVPINHDGPVKDSEVLVFTNTLAAFTFHSDCEDGERRTKHFKLNHNQLHCYHCIA